MRHQNMRMHVAVIPPLARLVDRDIDGDAVAFDDRREVILQKLLALFVVEFMRQGESRSRLPAVRSPALPRARLRSIAARGHAPMPAHDPARG